MANFSTFLSSFLQNIDPRLQESSSGCGKWCYVNDGSTCYDARPSSYGAPYYWSCQARGNIWQ